MSRGQLRELSPDATRAVREMIQRKRQGQDGTCPRPAKPAQQLRQLGDVRRDPPRLSRVSTLVANGGPAVACRAHLRSPHLYFLLIRSAEKSLQHERGLRSAWLK